MNNLKLPAYPLSIARHNTGTLNTTNDVDPASVGFTKLELASLMIAQGLVSKYNLKEPADQLIIAQISVQLAETVLKEANI